MSERFLAQFAPTEFVTKDDFAFLLRYLQISAQELQILLHAIKVSVKSSRSQKEFLINTSNTLSSLSRKNSILGNDAKILARLMSETHISAKTWVSLKEIIREIKEKTKKDNDERIDWNKINYYIEKIFTASRFSEWAESICKRANPGALNILHKFVYNPELRIVFINTKSKKKRIFYYPFVQDGIMRKHLIMKEVYNDPVLFEIIAGDFKVLQIIE